MAVLHATVARLNAMTPVSGLWPRAGTPDVSGAARELAAMVGAEPTAITDAHNQLLQSMEVINRAVGSADSLACATAAQMDALARHLLTMVHSLLTGAVTPVNLALLDSAVSAVCTSILAQAQSVVGRVTQQLEPVVDMLGDIAARDLQTAAGLGTGHHRLSVPDSAPAANRAAATAPSPAVPVPAPPAGRRAGSSGSAAPGIQPATLPQTAGRVPPVRLASTDAGAGFVPPQLRGSAVNAVTSLFRAFGAAPDGSLMPQTRNKLTALFAGDCIPGADMTGCGGATPEEITRGRAAADYALSLQGLPYVWGGTNPRSGVDCSGLTQLAWRHAGVDIPRLAADQATGRKIPPSQMIPGDLVVWSGHVAMYTGDGMIVEAGNPVQVSLLRTTNMGMRFLGCWRPTG